MLSPDLSALLRCPRCRGAVKEIPSPEGLHCPRCALFYAIVDGIPNMLVEEARPMETPPRQEPRR